MVAALKLQEASDTANYIQQSLDWWSNVNVSAEDQAARIIDSSHCVQQQNSNNFRVFLKNLMRKIWGMIPLVFSA